jgi:DNA-binding response OmpR family regulator
LTSARISGCAPRRRVAASWDCTPAVRRARFRARRGGGILTPIIGKIVVARGVATAEQVEAAARDGRARGQPLCSRLLADGVDEGELVAALAERQGVPGVDLSRSTIALDVLDLVPRAVAEADVILPLAVRGGRVHVAVASPSDERVIAELRFVTGREVSAFVAIRAALLRAICDAYEARACGAELWHGSASVSGAPHLATVIPGVEDATAAAELIPDDEVVIEIAPEPLRKPAPRRGQPLVLVVDDEAEIRKLVARTLGARGYEVAVAADGEEALAKVDELVPDLVLLDAMLPKVHGFDACRRIKASTRTRDVPVIMMTAIYRGWRFAQDARDAYGACDYVEKPFRLDDLLRSVEAALAVPGAAAPAAAAREEPVSGAVAHGRELLASGNVSDAVAVLTDAVRAHPRSASACFHLGRALRATGDVFGAMTALERAIEASPRHLPALRALAALYEEGGFRRKAAETLERALPAAPDDVARSAIRADVMRLIA